MSAELRDFTYADFCGWHDAYVLDAAGVPEKVSPYYSQSLANGDKCIRFRHVSGFMDQANLSEGRLKTTGKVDD